MSSAMGAGVGRMREVCGAVSSMAMLAGLKEGNSNPQDEEAKERIYARVRQMSERFRKENGSIICKELLGITEVEESAKPQPRTREYYESRPCPHLIACAARIIEEELLWFKKRKHFRFLPGYGRLSRQGTGINGINTKNTLLLQKYGIEYE